MQHFIFRSMKPCWIRYGYHSPGSDFYLIPESSLMDGTSCDGCGVASRRCCTLSFLAKLRRLFSRGLQDVVAQRFLCLYQYEHLILHQSASISVRFNLQTVLINREFISTCWPRVEEVHV